MRAGLDAENLDRSWLQWRTPQNHNEYYQMEVRAIDDDGKVTESHSSTHSALDRTHVGITKYFKLPLDRLARFEYRLRPYRHLVRFDQICTDPAKRPRSRSQSIGSPTRRSRRNLTVEKSRLLILNPDNTPWQGSLVAGHIGFIPPDAKAWNASVDKDVQVDLSAHACGQALVDLAVPLVCDPHRDSAQAATSPATATGGRRRRSTAPAITPAI